MKKLILLVSLCALALADTGKPSFGTTGTHVYVALAAVPATPTAAMTSDVEITQVVLTNTNASTQATVTVSCTTSGVVFIKALINGVSSQNNHFVAAYPKGLICVGGVTWGADITLVTGSINGDPK